VQLGLCLSIVVRWQVQNPRRKSGRCTFASVAVAGPSQSRKQAALGRSVGTAGNAGTGTSALLSSGICEPRGCSRLSEGASGVDGERARLRVRCVSCRGAIGIEIIHNQ
jgi:hypothetical protein